ncbi:MAG: hypothetical protein K0Q94_92 [Paenibacillus sp.]|uniref:DUF4184 family protein n=1 Tax=Paenibacillus sp. GCM10012303 TaxID=3317340 RepID=UPI0029E8AB1F|nr:hypothetical protein [Paenibacillus sp.]
MPYTPAHPITAIAIDKLFPNKFNRTGLVAGTLAPDLMNFVVLRPADTGFGHSPLGMLTIGLPVSILMCYLFHKLVFPGLVIHLPRPLDRILYPYVERGWRIAGARAWTILVVSIVVGMISHLFLDGFTHKGGLMYPYTTVFVHWLLPGFGSTSLLLQFGLSVVCVAIELLVFVAFLYRRRDKIRIPEFISGPAKTGYWSVVLLFLFGATALGLLLYDTGYRRYGLMIVSVASVTGAVIGFITASAVFLTARRRRPRADRKQGAGS